MRYTKAFEFILSEKRSICMYICTSGAHWREFDSQEPELYQDVCKHGTCIFTWLLNFLD